jgi:hypothetical protein
MARDPSVHDLLTPQHQTAVRREYWVERVAWTGMVLILLAALLGAFGPGLLSDRRVVSPDGLLSIEYSAIERYQAESVLLIRVERDAPADRPVLVTLSRSLSDRTQLVHLTPPPEQIDTDNGKIVLAFPPAAVIARHPITYRYEHEHIGPMTIEVGLAGGQSVRIQQFVLP